MTRNERSGFLALFVSASMFSVTSMLVKMASSLYSGYSISTIRFLIGAVLSLIAIFATRGRIVVVNRKDWILRGAYGAVSMTLSYAAIALTSNGRATLLANTYPIFVAIFASLFFGEKLAVLAIPSLALCTLGSIAILNDGAGYAPLGDGLALLSAVFAGLAVNHLKRARNTDDPFILYLAPCLFGIPISVAFGPKAFTLIPGPFVLALLAGALVFLAQILMTWGYKHVPAARGSRVFYLETLLSVLLGACMGERLKPAFFIGGALILVGLALDSRGGIQNPRPRHTVRS